MRGETMNPLVEKALQEPVDVPVPEVDPLHDSTEFPHVANRDEFYDAALDWVNGHRQRDGKRPLVRLPRAVVQHPCHCCLGRATGYIFWDNGTFTGLSKGLLPHDVAIFEHRFETGQYPELVVARYGDTHQCPWDPEQWSNAEVCERVGLIE